MATVLGGAQRRLPVLRRWRKRYRDTALVPHVNGAVLSRPIGYGEATANEVIYSGDLAIELRRLRDRDNLPVTGAVAGDGLASIDFLAPTVSDAP